MRDLETVVQETKQELHLLRLRERQVEYGQIRVGRLLVELQSVYFNHFGVKRPVGRMPQGVLPFRRWAAEQFGLSETTVAQYMVCARHPEHYARHIERLNAKTMEATRLGRRLIQAARGAGLDLSPEQLVAGATIAKNLKGDGVARVKAAYLALSDQQQDEFLTWLDAQLNASYKMAAD